MGRPSSFNQKVADEICARIANGESLRGVCRDEKMPVTSTVCKWLCQQNAFAEQYARAKAAQADALVDEMLQIADEPIPSTATGGLDSAAVQKQRLQIDTRKWYAGKVAPKKYGDKVLNELSGPDGGPVQVQEVAWQIVDPAS